MLDLKLLQKEYVSLTKEVRRLESDLFKRKSQITALHNALIAYGETPEKVPTPLEEGSGDESEASFQHPVRIISLSEAIKEAIPPTGKVFRIDDVLNAIGARFPALDRQKLAGMLWRLREDGVIKQLEKGSRGTPAQYTRV